MKTPEERVELLRQQVISKIHWGAREQEVTDWLQEKHGIVGPEAGQLVAAAFRARCRAVRSRALIRIAFSAAGLALVAAFFYTRFFCGFTLHGPRAIFLEVIASGLGVFSLSTLILNLGRLFTGEQPGSVD